VEIEFYFFADFDDRILKQQEEEEERKRQRREKKKEKVPYADYSFLFAISLVLIQNLGKKSWKHPFSPSHFCLALYPLICFE
jgi:5'-3' exonuclease